MYFYFLISEEEESIGNPLLDDFTRFRKRKKYIFLNISLGI